jgi:hypothetical protein
VTAVIGALATSVAFYRRETPFPPSSRKYGSREGQKQGANRRRWVSPGRESKIKMRIKIRKRIRRKRKIKSRTSR